MNRFAVHFVGKRGAEAVIGSSKSDDGLSRIEVSHDFFQLVIGKGQQAGHDDDKVGGSKVFQPRDVVFLKLLFLSFFRIDRHGWINFAFFIYPEKDSAIEAVMFAQDPRHHGQGLFAAVFLIRGDENDVFSFAGSGIAWIDEPFGTFRHGMGE